MYMCPCDPPSGTGAVHAKQTDNQQHRKKQTRNQQKTIYNPKDKVQSTQTRRTRTHISRQYT